MLIINPHLDSWGLCTLLSDPDNWGLLDQVASHPAVWPDLLAWVEQAVDDPSEAGPPPEPSQARHKGLLPRRRTAPLIESTDGPPQNDVANQGHGPAGSVGGVRAMAPSPPAIAEPPVASPRRWSSLALSPPRMPHRTCVRGAVAALATLALFCLAGSAVALWARHAHEDAYEYCIQQTKRASRSSTLLGKSREAARRSAAIEPSELKDPGRATVLGRLLKGAVTTRTGPCTDRMGTGSLKESASGSATLADRLDRDRKRLDTRRRWVLDSRDAKVLSDARSGLDNEVRKATSLLDASNGKVADDTTRQSLDRTLKQASTARRKGMDATACNRLRSRLSRAQDRVRASMDAKAAADAAKGQASEAAQGGRWPSAPATPQRTPSQPPTAAAPPQSPSWTVPPVAGDETFPDRVN